MTHPAWKVDLVVTLRTTGLGARRIGRQLGIPTSTVTDWLAGRAPSGRGRTGSRIEGCAVCGHETHVYERLPPDYTYLLGLYLGDGCISAHRRRVYRLRITLDAAYPAIIAEAEEAMRRVIPASKANTLEPLGRGYIEVYSCSKAWPCLFPQHGPGKKHQRPIVLTDWQERLVRREPHRLLRGLIHSDGCRFMNTGKGWSYPRYSFANLSPDIRRIFTDTCDLLSLHWTTAGRNVYVSRKADVDRMDRFIGPKA